MAYQTSTLRDIHANTENPSWVPSSTTSCPKRCYEESIALVTNEDGTKYHSQLISPYAYKFLSVEEFNTCICRNTNYFMPIYREAKKHYKEIKRISEFQHRLRQAGAVELSFDFLSSENLEKHHRAFCKILLDFTNLHEENFFYYNEEAKYISEARNFEPQPGIVVHYNRIDSYLPIIEKDVSFSFTMADCFVFYIVICNQIDCKMDEYLKIPRKELEDELELLRSCLESVKKRLFISYSR